ncbi:hypothetical protein [Demequina sp.]|uniref:hypothetical protein n=1 Tax=Demequina sp. TaxID=2050685 RepID=UPI0025BF7DB2|nr:hypothetical protein [Demequina sp.]
MTQQTSTQESKHDMTPRAELIRFGARGVIGGAVAGAVFGALNMWFAHSQGMPTDTPLKMIATIVQGENAMADGTASPALGLVVHMVLSMMFGLILALLVLRMRSDALRSLVGLLFGAALYLVNFLVMAPLAYGVFEDANQPLELATHIVFGSVAVVFLMGRRATQAR